jgi:hypothetical protein
MKYRIFNASFSFVSRSTSGVEYVVIAQDSGGEWKEYEVCNLKQIAEEKAQELTNEAINAEIVQRPRSFETLRVRQASFTSESEADSWIRSQMSSVEQGTLTGSRVDAEIIEADDLSDYEHKPVYTVMMEITTVKRLEVEIDTEEYDEVEDEYDAEVKAKCLYESGDLDSDLDYTDVWDSEVEIESVEEN